MCLSIAVHHPDNVLGSGTHAGHEWMIVHNSLAARCGYVKVEPGHPWFNMDWDAVDCEVHGGLTFAEADEHCGKGGPDNGWWVGFDCSHAWDAPDPSLPGYERVSRNYYLDGDEVVRTQEYVEAECRSLCEQARDAALAAASA